MTRQRIRRLLLIISLLLFPITLYYFSPALIINAGLNRTINGSFIVFVLMFLLSIPFGRIFCSYFCPTGGLQECAFAINEKNPKQGWRNYIKFIIWGSWLIAVVFCYFYSGEVVTINFFFETENGISVSSIQSYIIYYGIVCLVFIPSILFGKRVFCHYFCWMAPFMMLGTKLRRVLHLPGIHIKTNDQSKCISCGKCNKVCPMGIDVISETKNKKIDNTECIQCGACIDNCPKNVLTYGIIERKENNNGK
ncbi:MAG: 4Fe-4S binding protein [Ruminococcaceae bacterium]|nr:4Fe-4S binding protein [Oscillospiraceae bacterium]